MHLIISAHLYWIFLLHDSTFQMEIYDANFYLMCHSGRNLERSPLDNAAGILLNFLYLCLSDTVRVNVKNRTAEKYWGRCMLCRAASKCPTNYIFHTQQLFILKKHYKLFSFILVVVITFSFFRSRWIPRQSRPLLKIEKRGERSL